MLTACAKRAVVGRIPLYSGCSHSRTKAQNHWMYGSRNEKFGDGSHDPRTHSYFVVISVLFYVLLLGLDIDAMLGLTVEATALQVVDARVRRPIAADCFWGSNLCRAHFHNFLKGVPSI